MMKPRPIVIALVALLVCSGLAYAQPAGRVCVSQEVVPAGADDFTFLGIIDIFNRSATSAAAVYSYGSPSGASYNGFPPDSISDTSQLFLVQTNDGSGPSLFFVHDRPEAQLGENGDGGRSWMQFDLGGGDTAAVLVRDDPGEAILVSVGNTRFESRHTWLECCTDGGVIGTLEGAWRMDAQFLWNVPFDPGPGGNDGITAWQATSAGGGPIPLVLELDRRARLESCNDVDLIDLKPGSNPNCVNPRSGGVVSVAILSTNTFDALDVDEDTILFGGASPLRCAVEDVGADLGMGDGDLDLVCKFRKRHVDWPAAGADCGFVQLSADLFGGGSIVGGAVACLPGEPTCEAGTPTTP